jgi:hypothetical protein
MNAEQLKTYLVALTGSVTIGVLIPLLILVGITAMIWFLISRAQKDPDFDIANTLRDEAGKESATRVLTFGAFAVTSWGYAVSAFALPQYFSEVTLYYLAFWSGSPVALKLAEKWNGNLPWSK